ncbi:hypothetical protein [Maledivibacter halophilus]|uniref:DUF3139 domain-containing protein n=1 Tax=Maledivibacter halophilus TaxID=36842 RepID=A0A1T5MF62_9FIRM|nr:hypothetical protein [Maledivibacter halophilus]SKC86847.1 hypothetical protein SAMN02194393_04583 [Maledivibacter halophilus]
MKEINERKKHVIIFIGGIIITFLLLPSLLPNFLNVFNDTIKENNQNNPYYYTKGIVKEKYIKDGLFGFETQYIKIQIDDWTDKVASVEVEYYLLAEEDNQLYVILDSKKEKIVELKFSDKELNKYIKSEKKIGRHVKLLEE